MSGPAVEHSLVTPNLLAQSKMPRDLLKINSLAILPPEIDDRVRHAQGWPASVSEELDQAAREQLDIQVTPTKELRGPFGSVQGREGLTAADFVKIGKQVGVDGVLYTKLTRYVDREGSSIGATTPAGVDFTMSLRRTADGKEVWEASYHFQDAALTDNLFKVQERLNEGQGPGWRSANDLLASGFRAALNDFSTKRLEQFSAQ